MKLRSVIRIAGSLAGIAVRGISLYAPKGRKAEFDRRIERARNWMIQARPATAEESIQRLFGLTWAGANAEDVQKAQRPDGGQYEDGSWLVKTRAFPFQPLVESGFPHGRDQWISASGTGWAIMALMLTTEPPETVAAR